MSDTTTPANVSGEEPGKTQPDPVIDGLVSSLLGMGIVEPEEAKKEEPKPEPKKEEPKKEEPKPEPKKVAVAAKSKPEPVQPRPNFDLPKEQIETAVAEAVKKALPVQQAPAQPVPDDLSEEEKEELALAEFAEKKDPAKKGLSSKLRQFYTASRKYLEARAAEEGEDYDPTQDPKYKAFLAKNEPQFTASERKKFNREMIVEETETRAVERMKKEMSPQMAKLEHENRVMKEGPKVEVEVNEFAGQVASEMPEEMVKYFTENGNDLGKLKEAFPVEFDICSRAVDGATALAREALAISRGISQFDPSNARHKFIDDFVNQQAEFFAKQGGAATMRDGKQFIPPAKFKTGMTGWTFSTKDVMQLLKINAVQEAKNLISLEKEKIERALAAKEKRNPVQKGTVAPSQDKVVSSPKSEAGHVAPPPGTMTSRSVSGLLNLS